MAALLKDSLLLLPGEFDFQHDLKDFFLKYQSTPFFDLIKKCSIDIRIIDESIRFFYPWFFPREFQIMDTSDEGMYFQSQVRNGSISSNYFFPLMALNCSPTILFLHLNLCYFSGSDSRLLATDTLDSIVWTASSLPFKILFYRLLFEASIHTKSFIFY